MSGKIEILDSTLRDGAQGEGISFSVEDKINIVRILDDMGISFIEAGNPGSNPKDCEFFDRVKGMSLRHSELAAFGSTRRKHIRPEEDQNLRSLLGAGTKTVVIFGKSWDLHVREILGASLEENLLMIEDTVRYLREQGRQVVYDAEHFFDGYKKNPDYALSTLRAAARGGARCLTLCDTNGGCFPSEIHGITSTVREALDVMLGIHCHNDGGVAVANSIMAVEAGAGHVQGTFLGYGERCGNANLSTIIPGLQLKMGYDCIPADRLPELTAAARYVAEVSNVPLMESEPYVGRSAFAHKAGMHADGVLKNSITFEHLPPASVGNERRFLMSEIAGRTAVLSKIKRIAPELTKDSPETKAILERLKELEQQGYQFEAAEASFERLVRMELGKYRPFFELISYRIIEEQPPVEDTCATAMVKIRVGDKTELTAAQGDGPVHALDRALRRALEVFYPQIGAAHLTDYKVRVMEPRDATAAKVRVLIESTDGLDIWSTVGVSTDVIEASWIALVDSIEHKLIKDTENRISR